MGLLWDEGRPQLQPSSFLTNGVPFKLPSDSAAGVFGHTLPAGGDFFPDSLPDKPPFDWHRRLEVQRSCTDDQRTSKPSRQGFYRHLFGDDFIRQSVPGHSPP